MQYNIGLTNKHTAAGRGEREERRGEELKERGERCAHKAKLVERRTDCGSKVHVQLEAERRIFRVGNGA
jgi:hypothetical protein